MTEKQLEARARRLAEIRERLERRRGAIEFSVQRDIEYLLSLLQQPATSEQCCIHCGRRGPAIYCGKQRGLQKCEFPATGAQQLTPEQAACMKDFENEMKEHIIPDIENAVRERAILADDARRRGPLVSSMQSVVAEMHEAINDPLTPEGVKGCYQRAIDAIATTGAGEGEQRDSIHKILGIQHLLTSLEHTCGCTDHDPEVCLEGEVDEGQRYCHCDCHKPSTSTPGEAAREDRVCPFCTEQGFDLIGLKSHLQKGDCEKFEDLERLRRL